MNPVPDISYFSVPNFQSYLNRRPVSSSSIILHNGTYEDWDISLSEETPDVYTWLHNQSGQIHDIYLPYTANIQFINYHLSHITRLIKPAQNSIKRYLEELGVENIETYMQSSNEWLGLLYAGKKQHYKACELATKFFGVEQHDMPLIIIWKNFKSKSVIILMPNEKDKAVGKYIKSIYGAIVTASKELSNNPIGFTIDQLKTEIQSNLDEVNYFISYKEKIRGISVFDLDRTIGEILSEIGNEYSKNFDDAVANFIDDLKLSLEEKALIDLPAYALEKRRDTELLLRKNGFYLKRKGGNHDVWGHPRSNKVTPVPRHNELSPIVARSIIRDIEDILGQEILL